MVLGGARAPLGTTDFSRYLLQAKNSQAKVVGLAVAGQDMINALRQASEFSIVQDGQRLAGLLVSIADVNSLGLQIAQGLRMTSAYYWDQNDADAALGRALLRQDEAYADHGAGRRLRGSRALPEGGAGCRAAPMRKLSWRRCGRRPSTTS